MTKVVFIYNFHLYFHFYCTSKKWKFFVSRSSILLEYISIHSAKDINVTVFQVWGSTPALPTPPVFRVFLLHTEDFLKAGYNYFRNQFAKFSFSWMTAVWLSNGRDWQSYRRPMRLHCTDNFSTERIKYIFKLYKLALLDWEQL